MNKKPSTSDSKTIDLTPRVVAGREIWTATREPTSLDAVQDALLTDQVNEVGATKELSSNQVVVDRHGKIGLVPHDVATPRHLAEVTPETFASTRPSLDRIRDQMLQAQQSGTARPSNPRQKIVADRNGRIGFEEDLADGRALSEAVSYTHLTLPTTPYV